MNASARAELNSIKTELSNIVRELEDISSGVRRDFSGIGQERCAGCIDTALQGYYTAQRKLRNVNTQRVTESFARAHGLTE